MHMRGPRAGMPWDEVCRSEALQQAEERAL